MPPVVRRLGLRDYAEVWRAMQSFTATREAETPDEVWLVEHPPVFTLGCAGKDVHILDAGEIPVVRSDRGGQVTYHGPGQLVVYVLWDLARAGVGVRRFVGMLEQTVIDYLAGEGIAAERCAGAPGVYVAGEKVAALGLRIRRGCCYHGLALNVAMDLSPYERIHPCGYPELRVTQLAELGVQRSVAAVGEGLLGYLLRSMPGRVGPMPSL